MGLGHGGLHDSCQHYRDLLLQLLGLLLHLFHFPHGPDLGMAPPGGAALVLEKQNKGERGEVGKVLSYANVGISGKDLATTPDG